MGFKRSRQASVSSSEDSHSPSVREHSVDIKIVHLDTDSAESEKSPIMRCSLPPHQPLSFDSFEAYDIHYHQTHMNRCSECQKNFPDEHFLHLHIAENHDPISAAKRDQGEKTYACLVPDCDRFCSTPQKRRLHCIDKHQFPRNYDFFIVNDGIDRRSSMLRPPHRRRSSALSSHQGSISVPGRHRGESFASVGENMELVKDEEEPENQPKDGAQVEKGNVTQREPVKLRGRGGFSHPQGSGRGRGRGTWLGNEPRSPTVASSEASKDEVDSLASGVAALQFIPHSVRMARGRGRGRGG